jgi:hypothetical protein
MLVHSTVTERLHYDPATGVFTWLVRRGMCGAGAVAGSTKHKKPSDIFYREIQINRRQYQAHRLAIFYMTGEWPSAYVDHCDGNGLNNRWENIRQATASENLANSKLRLNSTSGFKGATWHRRVGRWQSSIKKDGRSFYLGLFDTPEEAHEAYMTKAIELFGAFARAS